MNLQTAVTTKIVKLLHERNMTRYALCKKIAMSESSLKNIIDERYTDIKLSTVMNIADGFDLTLAEFFNDPLFAKENIECE